MTHQAQTQDEENHFHNPQECAGSTDSDDKTRGARAVVFTGVSDSSPRNFMASPRGDTDERGRPSRVGWPPAAARSESEERHARAVVNVEDERGRPSRAAWPPSGPRSDSEERKTRAVTNNPNPTEDPRGHHTRVGLPPITRNESEERRPRAVVNGGHPPEGERGRPSRVGWPPGQRSESEERRSKAVTIQNPVSAEGRPSRAWPPQSEPDGSRAKNQEGRPSRAWPPLSESEERRPRVAINQNPVPAEEGFWPPRSESEERRPRAVIKQNPIPAEEGIWPPESEPEERHSKAVVNQNPVSAEEGRPSRVWPPRNESAVANLNVTEENRGRPSRVGWPPAGQCIESEERRSRAAINPHNALDQSGKTARPLAPQIRSASEERRARAMVNSPSSVEEDHGRGAPRVGFAPTPPVRSPSEERRARAMVNPRSPSEDRGRTRAAIGGPTDVRTESEERRSRAAVSARSGSEERGNHSRVAWPTRSESEERRSRAVVNPLSHTGPDVGDDRGRVMRPSTPAPRAESEERKSRAAINPFSLIANDVEQMGRMSHVDGWTKPAELTVGLEEPVLRPFSVEDGKHASQYCCCFFFFFALSPVLTCVESIKHLLTQLYSSQDGGKDASNRLSIKFKSQGSMYPTRASTPFF